MLVLPLTATDRYAREDVVIGGVTIRRGERVFAAPASADRDESQFENADELDLSREPNRHVAPGLGLHYCRGAPLARLEGQIAISALIRRFPDPESAPSGSLRRRPGPVLNSLEALPWTFARRGATARSPARCDDAGFPSRLEMPNPLGEATSPQPEGPARSLPARGGSVRGGGNRSAREAVERTGMSAGPHPSAFRRSGPIAGLDSRGRVQSSYPLAIGR